MSELAQRQTAIRTIQEQTVACDIASRLVGYDAAARDRIMAQVDTLLAGTDRL